MYTPTDHEFMRRALALAARAMYIATPNPRVGCVIVRDGRILGEGSTQAPGSNHAEVEALLDARKNGHDLHGATAYVTLEPCSHFGRTPPCATALIEARLARVIAAVEDPNPLVAGRGLAMLRDNGVDVRCGLLATERTWRSLQKRSSRTRIYPGRSTRLPKKSQPPVARRCRSRSIFVVSSRCTRQSNSALANLAALTRW